MTYRFNSVSVFWRVTSLHDPRWLFEKKNAVLLHCYCYIHSSSENGAKLISQIYPLFFMIIVQILIEQNLLGLFVIEIDYPEKRTPIVNWFYSYWSKITYTLQFAISSCECEKVVTDIFCKKNSFLVIENTIKNAHYKLYPRSQNIHNLMTEIWSQKTMKNKRNLSIKCLLLRNCKNANTTFLYSHDDL